MTQEAADAVIDGEVIEDEESEHRALAVVPPAALARQEELTVDDLVAQVEKVKQAMQRAMTEEIHYGHISGVDKPTLFKPGAEKLCVLFRLAPTFKRLVERDGEHMDVTMTCVLRHITTGATVGEGIGFCSTRESRYAYRNANRVCPACGAEAIIKGKAEYGGGWLCWKKKDGCGATFADDDGAIVNQEAGKVANPDLPDTYNTVLKMAAKRALVAAVLVTTGASDLFTQDVEDMPREEPRQEPRTADGQDTRDRARGAARSSGAPSQAQLNLAGRVLSDAATKTGKTPEQILRDACAHYGVEMVEPDSSESWVLDTLKRFTGGGGGQISDFIDRLKKAVGS